MHDRQKSWPRAMTIEEFLGLSNDCTTLEPLVAHFVRAIEDEGFQNVTFARVVGAAILDLPVLVTPDNFFDTYFGAGCERDDAVLVEAARTSQPFFWNDVARRRPLTPGEIRTFNISREVGVHSGFSIPFHGPDGIVDLIGVSLRDANAADPTAEGRLVALASVLRWRYWQISNHQIAVPSARDLPHLGGPPGMSSSHCRALVLVEIAERRRRAGLEQMMRRLADYVSEADLEYLLSWGYVAERADDCTFSYDYAVTALGERHLATCLTARRHRRNAWGSEVPRHERCR